MKLELAVDILQQPHPADNPSIDHVEVRNVSLVTCEARITVHLAVLGEDRHQIGKPQGGEKGR